MSFSGAAKSLDAIGRSMGEIPPGEGKIHSRPIATAVSASSACEALIRKESLRAALRCMLRSADAMRVRIHSIDASRFCRCGAITLFFRGFAHRIGLARILLLISAKQLSIVSRLRRNDARLLKVACSPAAATGPQVGRIEYQHNPGLGQANERKHSEEAVASASTTCTHHLRRAYQWRHRET